MRILLVAAVPMEFRGILARTPDARPAKISADFAREAQLGGYRALVVANGMGRKRAAAALAAADDFHADAIVSTGFCGALDERLGIGSVVTASEVLSDEGRRAARAVDGAHVGTIRSIDHVAQTAEEKRRLRESGACAVEMEAAAVAEWAERRSLPFYCIRAVTDLANESMVNDFNRALRSDGHLDTINILRGALCRPALRIPELIRLRRRCVRAAEALGDFFVGCRF